MPEQVAFGAQHYQQRSTETSTLLYQLFTGYRREGHIMSYTMDDFRHDFTKEHLSLLTPEERLEGLSPEEILKRLTPEEILKRLPREAIENFLKRLQNGSAPSSE